MGRFILVRSCDWYVILILHHNLLFYVWFRAPLLKVRAEGSDGDEWTMEMSGVDFQASG